MRLKGALATRLTVQCQSEEDAETCHNKHPIANSLLLLRLVMSSPAQARLTLGVVTGTISVPCAQSLADQLGKNFRTRWSSRLWLMLRP
jgi:hypothetical protein